MGTKAAPNYAVTTVNHFEQTHVYTYHLQPILWIRYIDDIFSIWQHGEHELNMFIDHLNSCHPTLKFTHECSTKSVNFLDTTVILDNHNHIYTTVYSKATDTHMYLSYDSCHPQHCKTGLPYSQFLRLRRICTKEEDFVKNAKQHTNFFLIRGYPQHLLDKALQKAQNQNRQQLLSKIHTPSLSNTTSETQLFAITTFHPSFNGFKQTIRENWDLLQRSKSTRPLHNLNITFGLKRPKNLREHLVTATLKPEHVPTTSKLQPCNRTTCRYCPKLDTSSKIRDPFTKRIYKSRYNVSCNSSNLIYAIQCSNCNKLYVGQTKRTFKRRMCEHFRDITTENSQKTLGYHFSKENHHQGLENVQMYILDFSDKPPTDKFKHFREKLEKRWQFRLHSHHPMGLNTEDESPGRF